GRLSRIVGELQNAGPNVLRNVTLGITIHTGAGSPLLAELTPSIVSLTGHPYIETLLPGQKSPFEFLYTGLAYSVTDVQILNYTIAEGSPYQSLRLNDVSANFEPGEIKSPSSQDPYARFYGPISSFHVTGIVDNEGFSTVKNVRIVVTFYDKDGVMVDGVFWFSDPSKLKPNQTGDFEIVTRVRADEVATFIVQYAAQAAAN
ncbi:MAG: FxLYD domain-containing protein, partial [Candidatus Bathyarchaeia archaeon]